MSMPLRWLSKQEAFYFIFWRGDYYFIFLFSLRDRARARETMQINASIIISARGATERKRNFHKFSSSTARVCVPPVVIVVVVGISALINDWYQITWLKIDHHSFHRAVITIWHRKLEVWAGAKRQPQPPQPIAVCIWSLLYKDSHTVANDSEVSWLWVVRYILNVCCVDQLWVNKSCVVKWM